MGQLKHTIGFSRYIENRDCDDLEKGKVSQVILDDTAAQ
jgi:hypothetical protein